MTSSNVKNPGCPLIDQPYEATLEFKRDRLEKHLEMLGLESKHPLQVISAKRTTGWRVRARMVVNPASTRPEDVLGFYAQGSRDFVPVVSSPSHREAIEKALDLLRLALFSSRELLKLTRFVEARSLDGEQVAVVLCLRDEPDVASVTALLEAMHNAFFTEEHASITLGLRLGGKGASIASGRTVYPLSEAPPQETFTLRNGRELTLPAGSFFQQHPEQLLAAHDTMLEWMGGQVSTLLDLYSGVGAHGLALLADAGELYATDVDEDAIRAFTQNTSKISTITTHSTAASDRDVTAWLSESLPEEVDLVVTNPGRAGMHEGLTRWLVQEGVRRAKRGVLYMSCNLDTLARDLVRLTRTGRYEIARIALLDMMPFTEQLEILVLLEPGEPSSGEVSDEKMEWAFDFEARREQRRLSEGVSGVSVGMQGKTTWFALVSGKTTVHGKLPGVKGSEFSAQITCRRLFEEGTYYSGVRLECEGLQSDEELRQRLRAWGHPVIGDEAYGVKKVNRRARLREQLDRMMLHCATASDGDGVHHAELDRDLPLRWREQFLSAQVDEQV